MESFGFWFCSALVLIAFLGVLVYSRYEHKKRARQLGRLASERDWRYTARNDGLASRFSGFPFDQYDGSRFLLRRRSVRHVLTGQHRGRQFCCFEYRWKRARSSAHEGYVVSSVAHLIVAVAAPAHGPILQVVPSGPLRAMGDAADRSLVVRKLLGDDAVNHLRDLTSLTGSPSEGFARDFLVSSNDERFAATVLNPKMTAWMLADPRARETPYRFEDKDLLTWREDHLEVHDIEARLDYLCDVLDRVPMAAWG